MRATRSSRARSTARRPGSAAIIHHPDVKRMLMTMRADIEGCRAIGRSRPPRPTTPRTSIPDAEVRKQNQAFYEFMVPW
jgi:alkylation response protein AidB-like acyl-CoA dehydrogenase